MPCEHMGILLSRYVDGEASAEDRRLVEGHVRECADCRQELEVFRRNESLLGQALSEEVAGEAFIADVLARAGLAPSRPGRLRKALRGALRTVVAFCSSPSRVAAAILLGASACFGWAAVEQHRQNETLIGKIQDALCRLEKTSQANQALVVQISAQREKAPAVSQQAEQPPEQKPPEPPSALVQGPPLPTPPEQEPPAEEPTKELPNVVKGPPGGLFRFGYAEADTFGVLVRWETGPTDATVQFNVLRKSANDSEYGAPLNERPLPHNCLKYFDGTASPKSSYSYQVVGVHENGDRDRSMEYPVQTLGDLILKYKGVGGIDGKLRYLIEVTKYVQGQWVNSTFPVDVGEAIGRADPRIKGRPDFSTGCTLAQAEECTRSYNMLQDQIKFNPDGSYVRDPVTRRPVHEVIAIPRKESTVRIHVQDAGGNDHPLWNGDSWMGSYGSAK